MKFSEFKWILSTFKKKIYKKGLLVVIHVPGTWFTETHFVEIPCYPSKIIIIKVQITTVKIFGPIGDDLDIALVLQNFHSQITRVWIKYHYFKEIIVVTIVFFNFLIDYWSRFVVMKWFSFVMNFIFVSLVLSEIQQK
jgi:hypothetical protein